MFSGSRRALVWALLALCLAALLGAGGGPAQAAHNTSAATASRQHASLPAAAYTASDDENWDERFTGIAPQGEIEKVAASNGMVATYSVDGFTLWDDSGSLLLPGTVSGCDIGDCVQALVFYGGQLYVGGTFTQLAGLGIEYLARWDGSNWSAVGGGLSGAPSSFGGVTALAVRAGNLIVGGNFTQAGGTPVNSIAQWDGVSWSALGTGVTKLDEHATVWGLAVNGGDLYVSGEFDHAGGVEANRIARWDGSSWAAFGTLPDQCFAGQLAVSGDNVYLLSFSDLAYPFGALCRHDGANWSRIAYIDDYPPTQRFTAMAAYDGDLYVGGTFYRIWTPVSLLAYNLVRVEGSAVFAERFDENISSMAASDGVLYIGGIFDGLRQWNGDGGIPISGSIGLGLDDLVRGMAVSGAEVFVGGNFSLPGTLDSPYLARWNGTAWVATSGSGPWVQALAVSGGTVYAGSNGAPYIRAWNGSAWADVGSGQPNAPPNAVRALAVSGSNLYAGGFFWNIAHWNGSSWSSLGNVNGTVTALAVSGNSLYVGGEFTQIGGIAANHIARWSGSNWAALSSGVDGPVHALAVFGSDIYVGGTFSHAGGVAASNIARWTGGKWLAIGQGVSGGTGVYALAASQSDLFVGGLFSHAGGVAASNIARLNGGTWAALGSGIDGQVLALAANANDLFVGGDFRRAGGKESERFAIWHRPLTCQAVTWTGAVNVSASGNSLTKTAGGSGWNAGAVSSKAILDGAAGAVQVTVVNSSTDDIAFGLSNGNSSATLSDIDFGLEAYGPANELRVQEQGVRKATIHGYGVGDVLQVAVRDNVVRYYRNGTLLYTSTKAPTYPLLLDSSIYNQGAVLASALICAPALAAPPTATRTPTLTTTPATSTRTRTRTRTPTRTYTATATPTHGVGIANPDFEGGLWGWNGDASLQSGHSGRYSAYLYAAAGSDCAGPATTIATLSQSNVTLPADAAILSFWYESDNGGAYGFYSADVGVHATDGSGFWSDIQLGRTTIWNWTEAQVPVAGWGGRTVEIVFEAGTYVNDDELCWDYSGLGVDDIQVSSALPVSWIDSVWVSTSGNSLTKTAGGGGWNAGAASSQAIPAGQAGAVQATVAQTTTYVMFGLSNGDSDPSYKDIDFAIMTYPPTNELRIQENGVLKRSVPGYKVGDVLQVAVQNNAVGYYRNGTLLYTSTKAPTYPLLLDSSIYSLGGVLTNASIAGRGLVTAPTWTPTVTRTSTATRTATITRTATATRTRTLTATRTLTRTPTRTATRTATATRTPTFTRTGTRTVTRTRTVTGTPFITHAAKPTPP